jgi:anti-sigma28 factor (negative regulator of flagellin synthesis)
MADPKDDLAAELRLDKVLGIRKALEQKTYHVSAVDLADALLRRSALNDLANAQKEPKTEDG